MSRGRPGAGRAVSLSCGRSAEWLCVSAWGVADWRTDPVSRRKNKKNKGLRRVDLSATVADAHPTPREGNSPAGAGGGDAKASSSGGRRDRQRKRTNRAARGAKRPEQPERSAATGNERASVRPAAGA